MIILDSPEEIIRRQVHLEEGDAKRRRRTAYHEAGHAAMLFFLGKTYDMDLIDMVENRESYGRVMHRAPFRPVLIRAGVNSPVRLCRDFARIECRAGLMFLMAGLAAENACCDCPEWFDSWFDLEWEWEYPFDSLSAGAKPFTDLEQAFELAKALYDNEQSLVGFIRQSARMADEAITMPRLWKAVDALAKVLIQVNVLEYDIVSDILSVAWGPRVPARPYRQVERKWRRRLSVGPLYV